MTRVMGELASALHLIATAPGQVKESAPGLTGVEKLCYRRTVSCSGREHDMWIMMTSVKRLTATRQTPAVGVSYRWWWYAEFTGGARPTI
jgi:hypothetical protein